MGLSGVRDGRGVSRGADWCQRSWTGSGQADEFAGDPLGGEEGDKDSK